MPADDIGDRGRAASSQAILKKYRQFFISKIKTPAGKRTGQLAGRL